MNPSIEDNTNAEAPQWAVIELMGHVRYGGQVSKDTQLGTPLIRVDVPMPNGSFSTQLVNPQSIYRLTMCSEEIARAAAKQGDAKPMSNWELADLLPAPAASESEDDREEDLFDDPDH